MTPLCRSPLDLHSVPPWQSGKWNDHEYGAQAWGVLEHKEGNLNRAREMFQQAVWAQPKGKDVATVWQVCTLCASLAGMQQQRMLLCLNQGGLLSIE